MIILNINKLLFDLMPSWWRTGSTYELAQVLLSPLKNEWTRYNEYVQDNIFELKHNAQKLSFEHYLNDKVYTTSGITIDDGFWVDEDVFYFEDEILNGYGYANYYSFELDSTYIENFIFLQFEINGNTYDFKVNIYTHDASQDNLTLLNSYIDKLRLAGTSYIINYL